ncbi:MAG: hypothetical protein ABSA47_19460 [Verrucomicrobiota bacterium]|jgi:hypothetical protein
MKNVNTTTAISAGNNDDTFVIQPLVYQPTAGLKPGRFVDMRLETEPASNGDPRNDLCLVTQLEEKDDNGQPYQVTHRFNLLPRGRGKSEFKKQMESFLETPLTPAQLAGFSKTLVLNKPVVVVYEKNHLGRVVFDRYAPVKQTAPVAA